METSQRKKSHFDICLQKDVQMYNVPSFGSLHFIHRALPELNLDEVSTETTLLGRELTIPLFVSAMTGGHEAGRKINQILASAAQEFSIAFCVGSQHAALENPELVSTYQVRDVAENVFLFANLSASQLTEGEEVEEAEKAVEMIDADGLFLHLNPLQEAIQPEGKPKYKGVLEKIRKVCRELKVPVLVKETGCGISKEVGREIEKAGAAGIDVAGAGGTSWALVESYRGGKHGELFKNWGIPTPVCVAELAREVKIPVIAGGGIRSGLDAAKALALGASAVSVALPLLHAARKGKRAVLDYLKNFQEELRLAMFLTGCARVEELRRVPLVPTGELADWFRARGIRL
jgi:isopentenyl-diphosphate delta-isomerase